MGINSFYDGHDPAPTKAEMHWFPHDPEPLVLIRDEDGDTVCVWYSQLLAIAEAAARERARGPNPN